MRCRHTVLPRRRAPFVLGSSVPPVVIRVVIVSGIRLYRDGLVHVMEREPRVSVAGAFESVAGAIAAPRADHDPHVLLLDIAPPGALRDIALARESLPQTKVVALSVGRADTDVIACAEAGIAGYVFRDASLEELFATVESAARGELRVSPETAAVLLRRVANLAQGLDPSIPSSVTPREREIVELIDRGLSNKQIAAHLCIEVATVKNHVHNVLEKLGARNRGEAAARWRNSGEHARIPGAAMDPRGEPQRI